MPTTAFATIVESWYLSGIVSRGLETVSEEQITDGLDRLNALLDVATSGMGLIPYYREYTFNAIPNQEVYYIENLVEAATLTFNIGPVRYSILPVERQDYFATGRVDNISSLPYQWHIERKNNGADLYIYFLPQQAYPMKLWGKFALTDVDLYDDLETVYQKFYIEYIRYKLAEYLCELYNVGFPLSRKKRLDSYEQSIRNVSPIDLTIQKLSAFQSGAPFNYGDVNLGKGWRPPN